ncbi:transcriptional repressor [Nakamurella flavida]|uniref:Transcriptional repressor n=1 Tax=Nakamurella flavida TaxID=363630 RepID=A0A938YM29_9ACTN|nr:transcriptional repressor [Nakamurella flavida]MBM9477041.1 transcriptional repressor [Nakamurella flavida]MDP9779987.1 Fur family ferric uptake transcriptional regulator [Nakamurella flavida]
METLNGRLVQRGWRMTAQRRVIATVFDDQVRMSTRAGHDPAHGDIGADAPGSAADRDGHVHLTADEVHELATVVLPEISRATVYNTLNELVEAGELLAVHVGDRLTRYDPNVHHDHHHLVCTGCGAIFDVPGDGPELTSAPVGFVVQSSEVIFRGRCADCA